MIKDENKWLLIVEDTRGPSIQRKCFWMRDAYFYIINILLSQLHKGYENNDIKDGSSVKSPFIVESFSQICQRLNKFSKKYKYSSPISSEIENAFTGKKRILNLESLYADCEGDMDYWFAFIGYEYREDDDIAALKVPINISYNNIFKNALYFYNTFEEKEKEKEKPKKGSVCFFKSLELHQMIQLFKHFFGYEEVDLINIFKMKYLNSYRMKSIQLDYIQNKREFFCQEDHQHKHMVNFDGLNIYYKREFSQPFYKGNTDKEELEKINYPDKQEVRALCNSLFNEDFDTKAQIQSN